jgi:hypothetical protein
MSDRRKIIMDAVSDLVADFVFYDRDGDDQLSMDDLNAAFGDDPGLLRAVVDEFERGLRATYKNQE